MKDIGLNKKSAAILGRGTKDFYINKLICIRKTADQSATER
jgi:hypothetical protein